MPSGYGTSSAMPMTPDEWLELELPRSEAAAFDARVTDAELDAIVLAEIGEALGRAAHTITLIPWSAP